MARTAVLRILSLLLALGGLLILWQSTVWGLQAVPEIIKQLGSLTGETVNLVVSAGSVISFQIIGATLMGIGLFRASEFPGSKGEKHDSG
jgi:hypothetical protein